MLELRSVSKLYAGIPAVDKVSFSAEPARLPATWARMARGKSTTMKMITGLIDMTSGHVRMGAL